jgi:hypothetical protein
MWWLLRRVQSYNLKFWLKPNKCKPWQSNMANWPIVLKQVDQHNFRVFSEHNMQKDQFQIDKKLALVEVSFLCKGTGDTNFV